MVWTWCCKDRGNTDDKDTSKTYEYTLSNGYKCTLSGWSHTREYQSGYLRTGSGSGMAVVSGLEPGVLYAWKIYQFTTNAQQLGQFCVLVARSDVLYVLLFHSGLWPFAQLCWHKSAARQRRELWFHNLRGECRCNEDRLRAFQLFSLLRSSVALLCRLHESNCCRSMPQVTASATFPLLQQP